MSKNHKKELVTKGAVQEAIRITRRFPSDGGDADFVHIEELIKAIDRLPAEKIVKEDRWKARGWDKLQEDAKMWPGLRRKMDELLARERSDE